MPGRDGRPGQRVYPHQLTNSSATGDRKAPWGIAAWALFALLILVMIGLNPLSSQYEPTELTGDGDLVRQVAYAAVICCLVAWPPLYANFRVLLPTSMWILLAWCILSLTWAIEPSIAVRRLGLTIGLIFAIFAAVKRLGAVRTIAVLKAALLIVLIGSYLALALLPGAAIHSAGGIEPQLAGNWRGLLAHKNLAGPVCAVTVLVFLFDRNRSTWMVRAIVVSASAYFLVMTQSKTSIALAAVSVVYGALVLSLDHRARLLSLTVAFVALAATMMLGIVDLSGVWLSLSQPDGLTGRSQIWPALVSYVSSNPIFGAGFGSFWNIGPSSPVFAWSNAEWVARLSSGHNGYLDVAAQVGLPGLAFAILAIAILPLYRTTAMPLRQRYQSALCGALILFLFGHNFTESSLLNRDYIVWIFGLIGVAIISKDRSSHSHPAPGNIAASREHAS